MSAVPAVVSYGSGRSPILPLNVSCSENDATFSECSSVDLDVSLCTHVAGVDCKGVHLVSFAFS